MKKKYIQPVATLIVLEAESSFLVTSKDDGKEITGSAAMKKKYIQPVATLIVLEAESSFLVTSKDDGKEITGSAPVFLFCATQDRFYGQLDTVLSRRVIF